MYTESVDFLIQEFKSAVDDQEEQIIYKCGIYRYELINDLRIYKSVHRSKI